MMEKTQQQIKDVLKIILKQKKMTYEELASKLECSVPTVARSLGSEELGLSRLLKICEILEIEFSQLSQMIEQLKVEHQKFTEQQELFLSKNPHCFAFLMKLYNEKTPVQISIEFNLNPRSLDKYLTQLEKHELIVVSGKNKVRPSFKKVPHFGNGKLGKLYFKNLVESSSTFFSEIIQQEVQKSEINLGQKSKNSIQYGLAGLKLTAESYTKYSKKLSDLFTELDQQAEIEEKMHDKSDLYQVVFVNAHCRLDASHRSLKHIDNIFGEIPNI